MKLLGNIIWLLFGGLLLALCYILAGAVYCITIIGIPLGLQLFKIGCLTLLPFGAKVTTNEERGGCINVCMNIIWIFCGGIELALTHAVLGLIFCITIIGIPFGQQHFKLAALALTPFGKNIS